MEEVHIIFIVTFIGMMMLFFFAEAFIEKYKPPIGHQTGLVIVAGVVVSLVFWSSFEAQQREPFNFSHEAFFNFFLPPIVFNAGYNMRKKRFFNNLGNVAIFGLGVTFACWLIYSVGTYWMIESLGFEMTNYYLLSSDVPHDGPNPKPIELDIMKILLYTSLMCSSDVVAAVSIVDYEKQPKLYSCIFGEGVVNDIVSIILFNTVLNL
jgi:NhaP-type Na+/H+ or K+/H+ antiporter